MARRDGRLSSYAGGKKLQAKMETDRKLPKIYRCVEEQMSNVKM
jgi:hypothetical protein